MSSSIDQNPEVQDEQLLSKKLKEAREYLGLSQEIVAEKLNLSRVAISQIESCKRKVSSLELKKFSTLYRRPYDYFLTSQVEETSDEEQTLNVLFHTTRSLTEEDRGQVLKFAQFLKKAGSAPKLNPLVKDDNS